MRDEEPSGEHLDEESIDEAIQREILLERKFSLADAIGREGGCFLKGHNPIPIVDQVAAEINQFIRSQLEDPSGLLAQVLQSTVKADTVRLCQCIERPYRYLHDLLRSYLDNPQMLYDLKREVSFKWGQTYRERPFFQKPGEPAHPDDEYSHEIVRERIALLYEKAARHCS